MIKHKMNKLLILLVSTVFFVNNSFAMSFSHAKAIYNKVLAANHLTYKPTLILKKDGDVNAENDGVIIQINTGMLADVRDDDEMALVLGHELAHGILHHRASTIPNEYAADALGAQYMHNAGYSICTGAKVLKRFGNTTSDDHPAGTDRYARLGCSK